MKRSAWLGVVMLALLPGAAFASDIGIDAHVSTLGLGGELNYTLNSYFTARLDLNGYNYSYNTTKEQIAYDFKLHLKTYGVLVDLHPFAGSFRLTAGYFSNKNDIAAVANPQSSYTINGNTYSNTQVSSLTGEIGFNSSAPYLGFGWSTLGTTSTGLGFEFDLGALLQGSPKVQLSATGTATSSAQFQSDLAAEQSKFQNDVNSFKAYPVVNIGLAYRF